MPLLNTLLKRYGRATFHPTRLFIQLITFSSYWIRICFNFYGLVLNCNALSRRRRLHGLWATQLFVQPQPCLFYNSRCLGICGSTATTKEVVAARDWVGRGAYYLLPSCHLPTSNYFWVAWRFGKDEKRFPSQKSDRSCRILEVSPRLFQLYTLPVVRAPPSFVLPSYLASAQATLCIIKEMSAAGWKCLLGEGMGCPAMTGLHVYFSLNSVS